MAAPIAEGGTWSAAAARRILAEPGFRTAAKALGAAVRADLDAAGLVREIEAMTASHRGAARGGDRLWA